MSSSNISLQILNQAVQLRGQKLVRARTCWSEWLGNNPNQGEFKLLIWLTSEEVSEEEFCSLVFLVPGKAVREQASSTGQWCIVGDVAVS